METEITIKLNNDDCTKIINDLKPFVEKTNNLTSETYLFYNKLKGFNCAYSDIEKWRGKQ